MAISYNTGTTGFITNAGSNAGGTLTIPAGVLSGDYVFVYLYSFTVVGTAPTHSLTSTGTAPTLIGSQTQATGNNFWSTATLYYFVASATDHGKVLTFSETGGASDWWWDIGLVAYTGAGGVDVHGGPTSSYSASGTTGTTTTPSATTGVSGDWQIQFVCTTAPSTNNYATPSGLTSRESIVNATNSGVILAIADSNGSVGGSGTSIGNTTWTASGGSTGMAWPTQAVVGLQPAAAVSVTQPATGASVRGRPGRKGRSQGSPQPLLHIENVPPVPSGASVRGRPGKRGKSAGSSPIPVAAAVVFEDVPPVPSGTTIRGRKARKGGAAGSPAPLVHVERVPPVPSGTAVRGKRARKGSAQGSPQPLISPPTYTLYQSTTGGAPQNGPATASAYSGNITVGTVFTVTTGNCWFEGFWWWVTASGGQSTAPGQNFSLWSATTVSGSPNAPVLVVSTTNSATLTAGAWNYIPLATPVQLAVGGVASANGGAVFIAATSPNGPFPSAVNQFGSGDPYANGITSGPLFAWSDQSGNFPAPGSLPQCVYAEADGVCPVSGSSSQNLFVDVQVSTTPPVAYAGAYSMFPNQLAVSTQGTTPSDTNSSAGIQFSLSETCTLSQIRFYSSGGSTALPSHIGIFDADTGSEISGTDNSSPNWSGTAGSGWVYVTYTGIVLNAGNYKVVAYNAGTGDWLLVQPTYFASPGAGQGGFTWGPITVPSAADSIDGQATGLSAMFGMTTVASPNYENNYIDVEVTPGGAEEVPPVPSGTTVRGRAARHGSGRGSPLPSVRAAVTATATAVGAAVRGRKGRRGSSAGSVPPLVRFPPPEPPAATGLTVRGRPGRRGSGRGSVPVIVSPYVTPEQGTVAVTQYLAATVTVSVTQTDSVTITDYLAGTVTIVNDL
jgi:hypothetical protein